MEKAIHEKHLRLLIHCEVIKNHKILLDVIENYPEITKDELMEMSPKYHQFFETIYPQILSLAYAEWEGSLEKDIEEHPKSEHIKCDICNHDLEYVCVIHNRHNKKSLKIGRDCNKYFNIYKDEDLDKAFEKRKQLTRFEKLDSAHPYIQQKLSNWDEFIIKEHKYIFPEIKERYLDIRDEIVTLYNEYIKSKTITIERENQIIKLISKLLDEAEEERDKIIKFIEKNRTNILMPTKNMINGLRNTDKSGTGIKWLEEDAVIKARTLHRFRDEEFSKDIIPIYNELLRHKNIEIKSFNRYKSELGYNLVFERNTEVILFQKYTNLCSMCGMYITQEYTLEKALEELDYDSLYESSDLIDEHSIDYALNLFEAKLKNKLIQLKQCYYSYNEIFWGKMKNDESDKPKFYYVTKIDSIINILKNILYDYKKYNEKDIYEILINNSDEVSNSEAYDIMKRRNK